MGFKKVLTLDTETMVTIGGDNNPESVEGYFLGTVNVGPNKFNKQKLDYKHVIQTENGNVGVWGKTHMDRQLKAVEPGTMVRITFSGTKDIGKGNPMNCYSVEYDPENTILVGKLNPTATDDSAADDLDPSEDSLAADEVSPARSFPPKKSASISATSQKNTRDILSGRRS